METKSDGDYSESDEASVNRRQFLRASAVSAVGAGGAIAATGTATAGDKKCGGSLADAPWWYGWYDIENWEDHGVPWGADEITFYVNGWQANYDRATSQGFECRLAMEEHGYWGEVVGCHWDSVTVTWSGGKSKADDMGENLASLVAWMQDEHGTTIRLVGHSLGARVIGTCLNALRDDGRAVASSAFLGGAVADDSVVEDCGWWCTGEFYYGIRDAGGNARNYHSYDDATLADLYTLAEWDNAVGRVGADGTPPWNYTDHDVTGVVGSDHCAYYRRDDGCMDQVVQHF